MELTGSQDVQNSDYTVKLFEAVFDNPTVNMDKITVSILANRAVDRIPGRFILKRYRLQTPLLL